MPDRRTPLISGNWKMHLNHFEALQTVQKLSYLLDGLLDGDESAAVEVSVHPPFTDLRTVQTAIETDRMDIVLGAQHCHWEEVGAFTGEVSPAMLAKLNVAYVIAGHSERRELFAETDEMVRRKAAAILAHGMTPIVCVGETLAEREAGSTEDKVTGQVRAALEGLAADAVGGLVVAYEPIWAIGTGRTASAEDAQAVCALVRATVADGWGQQPSATLRVQYGGSVKPGNAAELMSRPDIDGALVGGASLVSEDFAAIVRASRG